MLRVVAIVLALWAVDRYMLNGQIFDASIRVSRTVLQNFRLLYCGEFEVPISSLQIRLGTSNSKKNSTRIIELLVLLGFRSSHQDSPRTHANFGIGALVPVKAGMTSRENKPIERSDSSRVMSPNANHDSR